MTLNGLIVKLGITISKIKINTCTAGKRGDSDQLLVYLNPRPAPSLPKADPAQFLPVLLSRLIDLGDLARQISHALSGDGNHQDKLPEVIQQLANKGGKSGHE